ncbi:MAG: hypothetical protein ACLFPH_07500 [Bacteroidales bacterium]
MNTSGIFYAKIMLFGEYSIINNSMALTIPYSHFNGELKYIFQDNYTDYDFARQSNLELYNYLGYLKKLKKNNQLPVDFDIESFSADLKKGLYFESTIPEGYGIGSSGALVASLYHKYVQGKIQTDTENPDTLVALKNKFATLESFYHGTSSGIDPLNSYLKRPLLVTKNKYIDPVNITLPSLMPEFAVFLINSGRQGKTGPLVNIFLEKIKEKNQNGIDSELLNTYTNRAIQTIIEGNGKKFFQSLRQLSDFQLNHFNPMIPDGFRKIWENGLENREYYIKLCGSGGGGFLLGFTTNLPAVRAYMKNKKIEIVPVYVHRLN